MKSAVGSGRHIEREEYNAIVSTTHTGVLHSVTVDSSDVSEC